MSELLERYVHQVGHYLPPSERAEIEAELRSQIQDQLDARFADAPTVEQVAAVLAEFGDPRQIAVSYNSDKYLVGPTLYPFMMLVLRYGWLIVPSVVIFLGIFGALITPPANPLFGFVIDPLLAALQATLIFSAVVVLFFAVLQHSGEKFGDYEEGFNPMNLPKVDDPSSVDRYEAAFGSAFGVIVMLVLLYFLNVGGLTLRFNLNDPGEVIPFPTLWMVLLIVAGITVMILEVVALRRNRWSVGLWLTQTIAQVFGTICLYFAVLKPFFDHLLASNPSLGSVPLMGSAPEIIAVGFAVLTLISGGAKLMRLWNYSSRPPFTVKKDRPKK
ncbi:MAG: hypothetical protein U0694_24515 [Anaerolineae bacterium]